MVDMVKAAAEGEAEADGHASLRISEVVQRRTVLGFGEVPTGESAEEPGSLVLAATEEVVVLPRPQRRRQPQEQ